MGDVQWRAVSSLLFLRTRLWVFWFFLSPLCPPLLQKYISLALLHSWILSPWKKCRAFSPAWLQSWGPPRQRHNSSGSHEITLNVFRVMVGDSHTRIGKEWRSNSGINSIVWKGDGFRVWGFYSFIPIKQIERGPPRHLWWGKNQPSRSYVLESVSFFIH